MNPCRSLATQYLQDSNFRKEPIIETFLLIGDLINVQLLHRKDNPAITPT